MADLVKHICKTLYKAKVEEICDKMQACDWEREIMLDLYCEPRKKTIESLEYSNKGNFYKRLNELETRLISFIYDNGANVLDKQYIINLMMFVLKKL